jgi:serpin B
MRNKAIAVLISIVLLGGCADNTPYVNPYDRYYANLAPEPVTTASIADETQQACHKFASDLLQQLDKPGENLFFSPFSLMVVLGMTINGASGETHRQMVQALGYDPDQFDEKAFNQQMRSLLDILKTAGDGVKLHRANGVWVDQSVEPNPDFLRTVLSYYDSQVFAADFVNNPRQAAGHINRWVSEQTNSMIDRLLAPEDLHSLTAIVLVNALYFDGKWANPFMPENTWNEIFHLENGNTRRVPMMRDNDRYPYLRGDGFQAVCLPYRRDYGQDAPRFGFYLFVPDKGRTVAWLREQWTPENWAKWHNTFKETEGEVQMPRFRMEWSYPLNDALKALGMELPFDATRADFRRMTAESNQTPLFIQRVLQKATIELDEQGTRVAVATGEDAAAVVSSAPLEPFIIVADRPFLFAIVHEPTGIVLFLGIVREP